MNDAVIVLNNAYYDSATLMSIAQRVKGTAGISEAVAVMATEHNRELLVRVGFGGEAIANATPRDLIVAVRGETESAANEAVLSIERTLTERGDRAKSTMTRPASLREAFDRLADTNMVLLSVPGEFAAREADIALDAGRHVMMFSDNVSLDTEIRLKKKAAEKGLLMMGPDCGTAIINGVPLAFANVVRPGPIGIIAAAGTGLQEVSSLIHRYGSGISQGIGTGGRDVKDQVGGLVFLPAMDALLADTATEVVLLVSKPTGTKVLEGVVTRIRNTDKPIIVAMLGGSRSVIEKAGGIFAGNLEEGARLAVEALAGAKPVPRDRRDITGEAAEAAHRIPQGRTDLRALYTGGTLCYEALIMLSDRYSIVSNVPLKPEQAIENAFESQGHCAVDLGEDEFTQGRPHPMMEPSLRTERIKQEIEDPRTAVILLDFVLGYGSHLDPAGEALEALQTATERGICLVASVTGTEGDPQNYGQQKRTLEEASVHVFDSNAAAVGFTDLVLQSLQKREMKNEQD